MIKNYMLDPENSPPRGDKDSFYGGNTYNPHQDHDPWFTSSNQHSPSSSSQSPVNNNNAAYAYPTAQSKVAIVKHLQFIHYLAPYAN